MIDKEFLTPQQLADRWNISRVWLYTLKRRGAVPKYRKLGVSANARITFPIDEVEKFETEHFELKG
jgi:predicted DNA-binding transcriptional regulator AlpA